MRTRPAQVAAATLVLALLAGCGQVDTATQDAAPEGTGAGDVEVVVVDGIPEPPPGHHPLPELAPELAAEDWEQYSGVARIVSTGNCTATLIDTGVDAGPAYLLTNGHCAGGWGSDGNVVVIDLDLPGTADFGALAGQQPVLSMDIESIAYSTMKLYDLAVLRLPGTLGEARAAGLLPVPISSGGPAPGDAVVNVGVPVQDTEEWVKRRGECTLGEQTDLLEGTWYWQDSWANDCPGIRQGSSGSPLLAGGEIVAVINTTTEGGLIVGGECALSNPCEIGAEGVAVAPATSYAVPVAGVGRCFGPDGVFALGEACPLPAPAVTTQTWQRAFALADVAAGVAEPSVTVESEPAGEVRYGVVPVSGGRLCEQESSYTGSIAVEPAAVAEDGLAEGTTLPVDLPAVEGRYQLCLLGADQDPAVPSTVWFHVDGTPPLLEPSITVERGEEGVWIVPTFISPELALVELQVGPVGTVVCADLDAFESFRTVPTFVPTEDLPATYCLSAADEAGNRAAVRQFTVQP